MRSRNYKIKNKTTGQFWTGYGNNFSDRGSDFVTWDAAAYEVRRQIKFGHCSLKSYIAESEIIEYEVAVNEVSTTPLVLAVCRSLQYEKLEGKFGRSFVRQFHKLINNPETLKKFKFAIKISESEYTEFRSAMKNLGFSSRHYKKTDEWLWISDEEVMLRAKLLDYVVMAVYLENEEAEYERMVADALETTT
jgi:hypothetical protein